LSVSRQQVRTSGGGIHLAPVAFAFGAGAIVRVKDAAALDFSEQQ
jgi:hypothetical protein